ncbi:MAG TPA: AMP-binding protein [Candidatus Dormibacteraeota bacterium]|nr:AMP-binding protein [Candidatus Dormibacteraeota bacterium]
MLSYWSGPDEPLWEKTIGQVLDQTVEHSGDCLALVSRHQSKRYKWHELRDLAECVARGLWSLGIEPGDRVGLWSTNCVEWVMVHLGCALAGAILVNVNPAYRAHELAFTLRKSRMRALFLWERDNRAEYARILEEARHGQALPLEHVVLFGTPEWNEFLRSKSEVAVSIQPEDVANIQYTSGTTGMPKGVMLTHRNQINNGKLLAQGMRYTQRDRICVPVPMYHCFGCVIGTMSALASGAAIVLPNWTFDASATLQAIQSESATSLYGVPAMFISELGLPEFGSFNLTSLRTGMMAGAPCPVEVMKRVMTEMHCPELIIGYGQTESTPVVTMSGVDDPAEIRVSTVGKALPCTEMKIVSLDNSTAPLGERGEVCARGYMVMKGYDGEPEATARAVDREGWLHTGDVGVMREDGYIHLTGRAKDMIIRGGENVYPREVEEFLYTHPKVAEVQVVGIPDERLGEVVLAWIRLKTGESATEDEVRKFCEGQIAYFKIPQHIRFVDAFPMTVTGKIQKFKIREFETKERGLESLTKLETA